MAATFINTTTAKGNFDGLIDYLKRVAYTQTPYLNASGSAVAIAQTHKWVSEDLNVAKTNARTEGFTPTFAAADSKLRVLESNEIESIAREFSFSDKQERIKKAGGIVSDYDHEKEKKYKEVSLDLDRALLIETLVTGDGDAPTAGAMAGAINVTGIATTNAGGAVLSTDIFDAFCQTLVDGGAVIDDIWCAGFNRKVISSWAMPFRKYEGEQKTMTNVVLKYDGSWGTQGINYDKHITTTVVLLQQSDAIKVAYLGDPLQHIEQAAGTIDGRRGFVKTEATLQYGSTKALGTITNTGAA